MKFSAAIVATVLGYTWIVAPAAPHWTAAAATAIVVVLSGAHALQTVLLHDAQTLMSRRAAIVVAAAMFAALHLPNPFLTLATFAAALAWCAIYSRHPNLLPLALSHALLTLVVLCALDDPVTGRLRVGAAFFTR